MAFKIADGYVEVHGRLDEPSFRRSAEQAGEKAGGHFTTAFGRSLPRHRGRISNAFRDIFMPNPGLMRSLMHPIESALSVPIVTAIAAGIVGFGVSAIAAAISSAILLGIGGVVVGGAAALLADKLKGPFERAMGTIGKTLRSAAMPLLEPFKQALRDIALLTKNLGPQFERIFKAAAPIIPLLVDVFGEFAKAILPAIEDSMPAIVEMFKVLAARSPEIADALAELLLVMADEETIEAFGYLLTGLVGAIDLLKGGLGGLTRMFNNDVKDIKQGIDLAGRAIDNLKGFLDKIPAKKITKYLFQPGAAISLLGRVTGLTKAIPRAWRTVLSFLGGGGAVGWALRVTGAVRRIPRAWRTLVSFLGGGGAVGWALRVTGAVRRIPRAWRTLMSFLGGGGSVGWALRVTGAVRRIPRAWRTLMSFLGGGGAVGWAVRVAGGIKRIPRSWRTAYQFLVGGALGAISGLIGRLSAIPRAITTVVTTVSRAIKGKATGGIIGAQGMQTGGLVGSRQVLVGEHGPEIAELPVGSRVIPHGQSMSTLKRAGGSGNLILDIRSGGSKLEDLLTDLVRKAVRARGGDVQVALGS